MSALGTGELMQWVKFDGVAFIVHEFILGPFFISDFSVVKFAAKAFKNPYLYFTEKETLYSVDSYTEYFTDMHAVNPGFVVRVCISASSHSTMVSHHFANNLYYMHQWVYKGCSKASELLLNFLYHQSFIATNY